MRIILASLPEPPDQVLQGLTIGDFPFGPAPEPWPNMGGNWYGENVLQGEWATSRMSDIPVPRAMVGWFADFALASSIGQMAIQGGQVVMVPIGPAKAQRMQIDADIRALYSMVPQDATGELAFDGLMLPSYPAPSFDRLLPVNRQEIPTPPVVQPRREVKDSGLLKNPTATELPEGWGRKIIPLIAGQVSYQVFTLTGTTVDADSVAVPNARVIAYQSGWRYVDGGTKIIAETVSDGSGNFSMPLRNIDYQLVAYKEGSPDLGGLTRQDVTPVVPRTIYMRDPTAPDGPSGSAVYRPVGSPIVRRIQ